MLFIASRDGFHVLGIVFLDFLRILNGGELSSIYTIIKLKKKLIIWNFDQLFNIFNWSTFATTKELNRAFTGCDFQIKFLLASSKFKKI